MMEQVTVTSNSDNNSDNESNGDCYKQQRQ